MVALIEQLQTVAGITGRLDFENLAVQEDLSFRNSPVANILVCFTN
jgi:hypothetical protein